MTPEATLPLHFVCCASNVEVLQQRLLSSPCLRSGGHGLTVHFNADSAATGFNASLKGVPPHAPVWLVWVHQDVVLPEGWDLQFLQAIAQAQQRFERLAVVGVYGLAGAGTHAVRAGRVLDRGTLLHEAADLPCRADSLDELLFAVRSDSALQLDAALGFDFYATDVVMQAKAAGWSCAVVDAYCEHWSQTPSHGVMPAALIERIKRSGAVFERKWRNALPVQTPCFHIERAGDVAAFVDAVATAAPGAS